MVLIMENRKAVADWLKSQKNMQFVDRLSAIQETDRDIKVGDKVMYTNQYGATFGPYEVMAISKDNCLWKYGRCVYLNKESYWFPCKPEELTLLQHGQVG